MKIHISSLCSAYISLDPGGKAEPSPTQLVVWSFLTCQGRLGIPSQFLIESSGTGLQVTLTLRPLMRGLVFLQQEMSGSENRGGSPEDSIPLVCSRVGCWALALLGGIVTWEGVGGCFIMPPPPVLLWTFTLGSVLPLSDPLCPLAQSLDHATSQECLHGGPGFHKATVFNST